MNKLQLSGAALIIGAAAMSMSVSPVFAAEMNDASKGMNDTTVGKCVNKDDPTKEVMTADNKSITKLEDCTAAGGNWTKPGEATAPTQPSDTSTTPTE